MKRLNEGRCGKSIDAIEKGIVLLAGLVSSSLSLDVVSERRGEERGEAV